MTQIRSIFADYVDKFFRKTVAQMSAEYINDNRKGPKLILHEHLTSEWTPNLTFATTNVSRSVVAADIVAMDSSIPLKKRPVLKSTRGDVPKLGIKRAILESEISQIDVMKRAGHDDIATRLLKDSLHCVEGIEATLEAMFLTGLSTGTLLVANQDGSKNGVRVNFGYKPENFLTATTAAWSSTSTAKPISDLQQLFDKASADGVDLEMVFISKQYMDYMRNTDEAKQLYANNAGITIASLSTLGRVSVDNMKEALKAEFGVEFKLVDQTIRFEKEDGTEVKVKPFAQGNVVAVPSAQVGRIVYGTLAEKEHPTPGCDYATNNEYTLVIKYYETDPKSEVTRAEALAIPVIDNAEEIYVLCADKTALLSVSDNKVEAGKKGTEVELTFDADSNVSASVPSGATWCTAVVDNTNNKVTIKVAANSGDARTTTITLSDSASTANTATIAVSQKAGA